MHWTLFLIYGVILFWVAPASFWRPSAAVLIVAWLIGQITFYATGDNVPVHVYLITDAVSIALIARWRGTWADTSIIAVYPAMWGFYFMASGVVQWWALYWLAMIQFALAGPLPILARIRGTVWRGPIRRLVYGV